MLGKASEIKTYFAQEKSDRNLGQVLNDLFEGNLKDTTIIDIKYASVNAADGWGWSSALVIYKEAPHE